ncbi:hypothetical protein L3Q72_17345 [Vibrio sp. JC009]|uniref:hypothetical protein n=1 Tax=Vibrio sp. JC009 TaxID=2912314 RepID=UPI0023B0BB72|nr:hypothetical protein [Vibrio sp. JC009]WED24640.1 hypothetical protein L3Q72_17345 [Vibrio sp. JC009]
MKYQVKEALDRINEITEIHPNNLHISRTETGEIEIECVDDYLAKHQFKYSRGELFMWDKVEKVWIKNPENRRI